MDLSTRNLVRIVAVVAVTWTVTSWLLTLLLLALTFLWGQVGVAVITLPAPWNTVLGFWLAVVYWLVPLALVVWGYRRLRLRLQHQTR